MLGEGLTLEKVEQEIATYEIDPGRADRKHEPTRGEWMFVRDVIISEQEQLGNIVFDSNAIDSGSFDLVDPIISEPQDS